MTSISDRSSTAPLWGTAGRLALWMLWLALALTAVGAVLVWVYADVVAGSDGQTAWGWLFLPIVVVAVSLLGSIRALRRGQLSLAAGLTLLPVVLAAIMNVMVDVAVAESTMAREWAMPGQSATTVSLMTRANIIYAVLGACFVLCVLTLLACIVGLVSRRVHPIP
jgi:hypothetical protein